MSVELTMTQYADFEVTPRDRKGNVADVQSPAFAISDESIASVNPHPDAPDNPLRCRVLPVAKGGAALTFRADSDLGEGVVEILGTEGITVLSGTAVSIEMKASAPQEQP